MSHTVNWFEIPVADFARAKTFYETLLQVDIERLDMGPTVMGMFPSTEGAVSGALVQDDASRPASTGTMVYLNGGSDLGPILARVAGAGGQVLVPKTEIGNGFGFFAHFLDTEGNKVGLHSMG